MTCPHCGSEETSRRRRRSSLGYRTSACRACHRIFNERTGTPFNNLQYPTDIVLLAVLWRLRYKLGFRDVAELLLQRGFEVTHETVLSDFRPRGLASPRSSHRAGRRQTRRRLSGCPRWRRIVRRCLSSDRTPEAFLILTSHWVLMAAGEFFTMNTSDGLSGWPGRMMS